MKYLKYFESISNDVKICMSGNPKREFLLSIVVNNKVKGGLLCGLPNTGENHFSITKVAVTQTRKGYGKLLYLSALSIVGNKGISPHRKENSTRKPAIELWERLNEKPYIKQIKLEKKLYKNNPILDSKYVLIDDKLKKETLEKIKKIDDDAFNENIEINKITWQIINKAMN